jgi:hypothetical protein
MNRKKHSYTLRHTHTTTPHPIHRNTPHHNTYNRDRPESNHNRPESNRTNSASHDTEKSKQVVKPEQCPTLAEDAVELGLRTRNIPASTLMSAKCYTGGPAPGRLHRATLVDALQSLRRNLMQGCRQGSGRLLDLHDAWILPIIKHPAVPNAFQPRSLIEASKHPTLPTLAELKAWPRLTHPRSPMIQPTKAQTFMQKQIGQAVIRGTSNRTSYGLRFATLALQLQTLPLERSSCESSPPTDRHNHLRNAHHSRLTLIQRRADNEQQTNPKNN